MKLYKLGLMGAGNMGGAIVKGAIAGDFLDHAAVSVFDRDLEKLSSFCKETKTTAMDSAEALCDWADVLLLAVKPDVIEAVITGLGDHLRGKMVISIALGWNHQRLAATLPADTTAGVAMPNTPCMVGAGMTLLEETHNLTQEQWNFFHALFSSIGAVEVLPTKYMGIGGALTGCGPAFLYMAIGALADGAVLHGLPREQARRLAAKMVEGAGAMALESGLHPELLKDNVCSPGGSTIAGVRALENNSVRAAFIDAVDAAYEAGSR